MSILLRTTLAATGILVATLTTPAMADISQAEQQRITGILGDQGYTDVRFSELDRDTIVSGHRDGSWHSFAYNGSRALVPVGRNFDAPEREVFIDRGRDK
jgi:hypothetical protein